MGKATATKRLLRNVLIPLIALALIVMIKMFTDNYREKVLKNSKKTWAILIDSPGCAKGCKIKYRFYDMNGKLYYSTYGGKHDVFSECHDKLGVGDTVYINYAVSDPEITALIHCYWNDQTRREMLMSNSKSK